MSLLSTLIPRLSEKNQYKNGSIHKVYTRNKEGFLVLWIIWLVLKSSVMMMMNIIQLMNQPITKWTCLILILEKRSKKRQRAMKIAKRLNIPRY